MAAMEVGEAGPSNAAPHISSMKDSAKEFDLLSAFSSFNGVDASEDNAVDGVVTSAPHTPARARTPASRGGDEIVEEGGMTPTGTPGAGQRPPKWEECTSTKAEGRAVMNPIFAKEVRPKALADLTHLPP